jgi:bacteriorhodopsin
LLDNITVFQYNFIYNVLSFTFAVMAASTLFFWFGRSQVSNAYKTAVTITGLVTFIAGYHYAQIFFSFKEAFILKDNVVTATGYQFNDAYRYVDWLLTVPLLLIELILVMDLPRQQTISLSLRLGLAAAIMVLLGYPGEISVEPSTRWLWWGLAMLPFIYIVYHLFFGLRSSVNQQPANARGLVSGACYLTVLAWCFYPIVFIFPMLGFHNSDAGTGIQIGYSFADIMAKAVFGFLIFAIASAKSTPNNLQSGSMR